ncbi:hypothetical protein HVZ88_25410 (plasmid) [Escherichia coli]|nr:hypothetical protein HVZ88_25410 [Escherichia coli]
MKHHQEKDPGVFIIWFVAALAVSLFFLVTSEAEGSQTMHLVDSYIDDGVKVCVYSDGKHYAYTERARGSQCPYTFISYD